MPDGVNATALHETLAGCHHGHIGAVGIITEQEIRFAGRYAHVVHIPASGKEHRSGKPEIGAFAFEGQAYPRPCHSIGGKEERRRREKRRYGPLAFFIKIVTQYHIRTFAVESRGYIREPVF